MINLAPDNPNGLELRSPVLVAPGCAESLWRSPAAAGAGALTTRWARWAPQAAASRWGGSPAGIVFERLPETGFRALLGNERKRWQRAPAPVLLALRGDLDELGKMAPAAGAGRWHRGPADRRDRLDPRRGGGSDTLDLTLLPLLALLPAGGAIEARAQEAAHAGVDALVVRAYPPAAALIDDELVAGVLVGPALGPLTVEAVRGARAAVELPLVALGGIVGPAIARAVLAAGATAIMVDGALHGDPRIAAWIGASAGVQFLILISANACEMR